MRPALSPEIGQQVLGEGYRVLVDLGKENVQFQSSGLVVSRSSIKSNLAAGREYHQGDGRGRRFHSQAGQ